ncbi:Delta(24(24(1)))-sterol reductase [Elsinoe australis]|uniref:Delta(24(24(1)))-sterol reductase n=1 Tax=Elsinoe australis TaxID=40998 RepID=A0A2P7YLA7_9PEZI|nr:Delta(24(24(1)))-sterol reductase [Elsinoe australis]
MSYASTSGKQEIIARGDKGPSPFGTGLFIGLRSADVLLQYAILRHDWGSRLINLLGSSTLPHGPPSATTTPLDTLGLSPYRLILLSMAAGSALKQNFWLVGISYEKMQPATSVAVSAFNTIVNSVNDLLFICSGTSASVNGEHFPQTPLLVGAALYAVGITVETLSEVQRYRFKQDRRNKGKVYQGGLFSIARHVNYTGYLMWRVGYATAGGGYVWGLANVGFFLFSFSRSIPPLNHYCEERYGEQWEEYKRNTPYKMIPFVY